MRALEILRRGTVIPATPLALNASRKLDERRQRLLMRYYLASGAGGIATAVHTTQFQIRDPKIGLYRPVLQIVADEIKKFEQKEGHAVVKVAGACGPVDQAVREAELAQSLGYDAVLLSPGGLKDLSEDALIARTKAVAGVMPVIGFYLQTAVGGRCLSFDYWSALCATPGVVAIKAAPFNRYQTLDVVRAAALSKRADEIALYTGNDDNIVLDLLTTCRFTRPDGSEAQKRFVGGLLGHWTVWTHAVVGMFGALRRAAESGRIDEKLLTLAQQVTDANAAFFDAKNNFAGCIAGLHEVLRRQGLLEGIWCLDPGEGLSPGQKEEIDRVLLAYPHLSDDEFVRGNLEKWKKG